MCNERILVFVRAPRSLGLRLRTLVAPSSPSHQRLRVSNYAFVPPAGSCSSWHVPSRTARPTPVTLHPQPSASLSPPAHRGTSAQAQAHFRRKFRAPFLALAPTFPPLLPSLLVHQRRPPPVQRPRRPQRCSARKLEGGGRGFPMSGQGWRATGVLPSAYQGPGQRSTGCLV